MEIDSLSKSSLHHTLMNFFELGPLWKQGVKVDDVINNIYGLDEFESELSSGKGVLLAAPHHGNWEVMNLFLARFKGFAFLYKPPSDLKVEKTLKKFRAKSKALQIEANLKGVRKIIKHLKTKGFIAILPDQKPKNGQGEFAEFFNHPVYAMTLFSRLAAKTKSSVFFIYAERTENGFDIHFEKSEKDIYKSTEESVQYINHKIQSIVEKAPAQYQWSYRRFSIQPEDEKPFY